MADFKLTLDVTKTERIDKYVAEFSDFSRTDIQKLIDGHAVFSNGVAVRKANFKVRDGDVILITDIIQREISAKPEDIPIKIIYEDEDIAIVDKDSGIVVHPAPGHPNGTLVNALLFKFKGLSDINGDIRPGIVHRIDKDTSGLLVVAKNNESHKFLAEQLKEHLVKRTYYAVVEGRMENELMHLNLPIGRNLKNRQQMAVTKVNSKNAVTHVFTEEVRENTSIVRCELETGRTHQIRVHLAYIKHPIVGDIVYGTKVDDFGQRLHAAKLELIHPRTKKLMKFESPIPKEFGWSIKTDK